MLLQSAVGKSVAHAEIIVCHIVTTLHVDAVIL